MEEGLRTDGGTGQESTRDMFKKKKKKCLRLLGFIPRSGKKKTTAWDNRGKLDDSQESGALRQDTIQDLKSRASPHQVLGSLALSCVLFHDPRHSHIPH